MIGPPGAGGGTEVPNRLAPGADPCPDCPPPGRPTPPRMLPITTPRRLPVTPALHSARLHPAHLPILTLPAPPSCAPLTCSREYWCTDLHVHGPATAGLQRSVRIRAGVQHDRSRIRPCDLHVRQIASSSGCTDLHARGFEGALRCRSVQIRARLRTSPHQNVAGVAQVPDVNPRAQWWWRGLGSW